MKDLDRTHQIPQTYPRPPPPLASPRANLDISLVVLFVLALSSVLYPCNVIEPRRIYDSYAYVIPTFAIIQFFLDAAHLTV